MIVFKYTNISSSVGKKEITNQIVYNRCKFSVCVLINLCAFFRVRCDPEGDDCNADEKCQLFITDALIGYGCVCVDGYVRDGLQCKRRFLRILINVVLSQPQSPITLQKKIRMTTISLLTYGLKSSHFIVYRIEFDTARWFRSWNND